MDCRHRKGSVMLGVRYDDECPLCAAEAASEKETGLFLKTLALLAACAVVILISALLGYASGWFFGVGQ